MLQTRSIVHIISSNDNAMDCNILFQEHYECLVIVVKCLIDIIKERWCGNDQRILMLILKPINPHNPGIFPESETFSKKMSCFIKTRTLKIFEIIIRNQSALKWWIWQKWEEKTQQYIRCKNIINCLQDFKNTAFSISYTLDVFWLKPK